MQPHSIIVWKDGTYKAVPTNSSWEFENDENWLVTISINEVIKDLSKPEIHPLFDEILKRHCT